MQIKNIDTEAGLLAELRLVNKIYREQLNVHWLKDPKHLSITQLREREAVLFNEWQRAIFDIVHASTIL
jgi:hypothetical protein